MHYRSIVDSNDVEWYDAVLDEYSSLDVNDFLHDISPYVTSRLLPPYQGAVTVASQVVPSTSPPLVQFVESDIFEAAHETRLP